MICAGLANPSMLFIASRLTVGSGFGSNFWIRLDFSDPILGSDQEPSRIHYFSDPIRKIFENDITCQDLLLRDS